MERLVVPLSSLFHVCAAFSVPVVAPIKASDMKNVNRAGSRRNIFWGGETKFRKCPRRQEVCGDVARAGRAPSDDRGPRGPLLEDVERPSSPPNVPLGRRTLIFSTICFTLFYVLLGAIERVSFARMASSMPSGVLLMHTLLAVMSLMLFTVLQLARSQSNGPPISARRSSSSTCRTCCRWRSSTRCTRCSR